MKTRQQRKIAIIVTWFGLLPPYFSLWLKSAEYNYNVDFLIFSDQEIQPSSANIHLFKTTIEETLELFELKLNRKININNSYKFCDCRPFFGITYSDYLTDYEFWGYCDVDLVFGDILSFLTDEILAKYDRFFPYGHLSIFRNCDRMNHLYDMPGGIYSYDEIFVGKAKTTPEEHFGINRICEKNNVEWYTEVVFADFSTRFENRLEVVHGQDNYDEQVFLFEKGAAYRLFVIDGEINRQDYLYIHWQKRKPIIVETKNAGVNEKVIITSEKLICVPSDNILDQSAIRMYNPPLDKKQRRNAVRKYYIKKAKQFVAADSATKLIWMRQKLFGFFTTKSYL